MEGEAPQLRVILEHVLGVTERESVPVARRETGCVRVMESVLREDADREPVRVTERENVSETVTVGDAETLIEGEAEGAGDHVLYIVFDPCAQW